MAKTTVVNIRARAKCDVYIGRPSPFGNPYVIGQDGDRDEVIRKYRAYFYSRLKMDLPFREQVKALKGKSLGCYCKPSICHGDVLASYLDDPSDISD